MDCQECQQRPATLHFSQVINGNKKEIHLCEKCAQEKGYMSQYNESFSLHNLLSGLFNFDSYQLTESQNSNAYTATQKVQCEKCGLTYNEFTRIGKFGCAHCYEAFGEKLNPIFRRVHSGNTIHDGKVPKRMGGNLHVRKQLEKERQHLQQLINEEAFEEAAQVRDRIRSLEQQLHSEQGDGDQ
ncbi:UvrB/UvrC motif-containing protein [Pontibacillus litoralis]|uniref:UVR domain-containing protein n=1 Tax=Pontibacillus litoralis JSM 072002 TaxID=1385512 RepID=A0A0A5G2P7_9BACI|nr:UvrB/UvrC motif-containing protein [Pontibacillus litoralis]KGX85413.1 hypothetical protein N784_09470 [Pontibacillus litoralis JSM 072002]